MRKFFTITSAIPNFSPASGWTYTPPQTKSLKSSESQVAQPSKENTPLPDYLQGAKKSLQSTNSSTFRDNVLLDETLNITWRYGDEYMDEIPITGEPGAFHLSSTGRKEKERLLAPPVAKGPLAPPTKSTPLTLKTDITPTRKGSESRKSPRTPGVLKRRKSKQGGLASPTSK